MDDVLTESQKLYAYRNQSNSLFIYLLTSLSAVGGFLFGYDTGVVSGAILLIRNTFTLSSQWQSLIVSATIGAAWIFSLIGGYLSDKIGRKPVILLASLIFTGGAIIMGLSNSKELLLAGRVVVGAAIGFASMSVPMYIGEIAPIEIRGILVTINNCCITFGQFVASLVDGAFSYDPRDGWRYMLGLAAIPSIIQLIGFSFMPETPRWLVSQNRYEDALEALRKVRGKGADIVDEFEAIKNNFEALEQEKLIHGSKNYFKELINNKLLRRALIVGCLLQIFQQIVGINTVMYYSAIIIEMSGLASNNQSTIIWLSAATSGVNFVASMLGLLFVERIGRRKLILGSLTGVLCSLALLAIGFQVVANNSPTITNHPFESSCDLYSSCNDCTTDFDCGYCFHGKNGSCLESASEDASKDWYCMNQTDTYGYTWAKQWCPTSYGWLTIFGLMAYLASFSIGMGPMPWTINSEIHPNWARSTSLGITTSFNWLFNFFISLTFLDLTKVLDRANTFWLYFGFGVIGWVTFYLFLPETKGKVLEEVENLFDEFWFLRKKDKPPPKDSNYTPIHGINDESTTLRKF